MSSEVQMSGYKPRHFVNYTSKKTFRKTNLFMKINSAVILLENEKGANFTEVAQGGFLRL